MVGRVLDLLDQHSSTPSTNPRHPRDPINPHTTFPARRRSSLIDPVVAFRSSSRSRDRSSSTSSNPVDDTMGGTLTDLPTSTHPIALGDTSAFPAMAANPPKWPVLEGYLDSNKRWAGDVMKHEPEFFEKGSRGQSPGALWIGCADSRAAENVILARRPGEIFVHRNIANRFSVDDVSANAVLEYAVGFLKISHVVVVGHSKCGGCIAAHSASKEKAAQGSANGSDGAPPTALSQFLGPLINLSSSLPEKATVDDLIRENVKASVMAICESAAIKENWSAKKNPGDNVVWVHGWVYNLETGIIDDLGISQGPANWEELVTKTKV